MLPNDTLKPNKTSGLRLGFAAVTTRGATKDDAIAIAHLIHDYLKGNIDKSHAKKLVKDIVSNWKKIENIENEQRQNQNINCFSFNTYYCCWHRCRFPLLWLFQHIF